MHCSVYDSLFLQPYETNTAVFTNVDFISNKGNFGVLPRTATHPRPHPGCLTSHLAQNLGRKISQYFSAVARNLEEQNKNQERW